MAAVAPYANMEAKGMLLDLKYMDKLDAYYVALHKKMRKQLRVLVHEDGLVLGKKFNFDSPEQAAGFIHRWLKLEPLRKHQIKKENLKASHGFRRMSDEVSKDPADYVIFNKPKNIKLKDGTKVQQSPLVSTSKKSLKGILAFYPLSDVQRKFLVLFREYRGGRTRYTRNVKGMRKFIHKDGRVRSSLLQHGTKTSRRASRDPQLQNIPRDAIIKRSFVAAENHLFVNNDYKNLEVRIAAAKSGDKALLAAFNSGKDIHSYLGSRAYNIDYSKMIGLLGTPWDKIKDDPEKRRQYFRFVEYRNRAKVIWWVLLFGGSADKIADTSGIPYSEATRLQSVTYDEFPGLQDMFDNFADFAEDHGYARTDFGRRRYLDGIDSESVRDRNEARRQALNTPIQGTAADITLEAVIKLDEEWRKRKLRAWNVQEVHDAIATEVHYRDAYEVMVRSKKLMESIMCPSSKGKIVFEIDSLVGCHLGTKLKVDKRILEMARTHPRRLYELCRTDIEQQPEFYAEAA
jgi:DNA polymerase I-like protein with 3'-5' exonuclease and polymerase domains